MEYIISAEEAAFKEEDDKLKSANPLDREKKAELITIKYSKNGHAKLLDAGIELIYRVGNSKWVDGDEGIEYLFSCRLLEDLYMYKTESGNG